MSGTNFSIRHRPKKKRAEVQTQTRHVSNIVPLSQFTFHYKLDKLRKNYVSSFIFQHVRLLFFIYKYHISYLFFNIYSDLSLNIT